jgi:uncharacterized protein (AIM24 family)
MELIMILRLPGMSHPMIFGGEGLFHATLSGTGVVLLQSCPASKMSASLMKNIPSHGGTGNKPIGGLGSLLENL